MLHFRTYDDLAKLIAHSPKIPHDVDLVVGVPRSGLVPAAMLALMRNKRLSSLDAFLENKEMSWGQTKVAIDNVEKLGPRVLIIDDSVASGAEMRRTRGKLAEAGLLSRCTFAAAYVTPGAVGQVDIWLEVLPRPRVFEWNLFHSYILKRACIDMDGVLCRDPTAEENDDGPRYRKFLCNAEPLHLPTLPVNTIVTCRLERYRRETQEWLQDNGVQFQHLRMMQYPDMASRRRAARYAEFKASWFRDPEYVLFIESSLAQASRICGLTGKNVFCVESWGMMAPHSPRTRLNGVYARLKRAGRQTLRAILVRARAAVR